MSRRLRAACVQLNAGTEIGPNCEAAAVLVRQARAAGAELIALPENATMVVQGRRNILARIRPEAEHPALPFFSALARETGAWLLVGSIGIRLDGSPDGDPGADPAGAPAANRSFLFAADGRIVARYDKIHMFDVDLANAESYRESATFRPGDRAVLAETPWGRLGLTICYDLRFPHLFRRLAQAGAELLTVPAAFTVPTGQAHWHVLLRSRAIETACFVLAPAQCGVHDAGRRTFGHSLIIDPWGRILAEAGEEPGVILADLDLDQVAEVRAMVPALRHDRDFAPPAG